MDHNNHINTVQNQPKNINKKRERNRIKKKKYKLKIKHKKTNTTPKYTKPSLTVKTNHGWRWFTLKSKQLSLKQGPRSKFSSGGAKEECVKENFFRAGGGGACLWISI